MPNGLSQRHEKALGTDSHRAGGYDAGCVVRDKDSAMKLIVLLLAFMLAGCAGTQSVNVNPDTTITEPEHVKYCILKRNNFDAYWYWGGVTIYTRDWKRVSSGFESIENAEKWISKWGDEDYIYWIVQDDYIYDPVYFWHKRRAK